MIDKGDVLLQQDVASMDYKQLAAWIDDCRNVVVRSDSTPYEEYIADVGLFCKAWAQVYDQNKKALDGKMERALRYLHFIKRCSYRIRAGGKTHTFTLHEASPNAPYYKNLMSEVSKNFKEIDYVYEELFANKEEHRTNIGTYVKKRHFMKRVYDIQVFQDGSLIEAESMDEFMKNCESKQTTLIAVPREYHASYEQCLLDFGITVSPFKAFISKDKWEQEFGKKFFVNLSLALELSFKNAEIFMKYNGCSLTDSMRKFDIVCEKALRIGFGRDYAIALIDRWNVELQKELGAKFVPIPNLTLQERKKA